jgi:hypothetical protein
VHVPSHARNDRCIRSQRDQGSGSDLGLEPADVIVAEEHATAEIRPLDDVVIAQDQPADARHREESSDLAAERSDADDHDARLAQSRLAPSRDELLACEPLGHAALA